MDTMTTVLAANWLEQKYQGEKTREAIARANPPIPVNNVAIDAHLAKVRADPNTFSSWMHRKGLFTLMRIALIGMTAKEKAESEKAYQYETGLGFPRD